MKHVMIDLETMGNTPTAAPIAIGAVSFGIEGGVWRVDESRTFYGKIQLQSAIDAGLSVDGSTVVWWLQQSEAARKEYYANEKAPKIDYTLMEFYRFFKEVGGVYPWGNGADFDMAILNNAYTRMRLFPSSGSRRQELADLSAPWLFWNSRCFRTLKNVFKDVKAPTFQGIAHNALADAHHQALHACAIFNSHMVTTGGEEAHVRYLDEEK